LKANILFQLIPNTIPASPKGKGGILHVTFPVTPDEEGLLGRWKHSKIGLLSSKHNAVLRAEEIEIESDTYEEFGVTKLRQDKPSHIVFASLDLFLNSMGITYLL
jgi:hypothetical protein